MSVELPDPRKANCFRFVGRDLDAASGELRLRYAFDDGPELVERIGFPALPPGAASRHPQALEAALDMLHWLAGTSYWKAGVPRNIAFEGAQPDALALEVLRAVYRRGLAEFAFRNGLDLGDRPQFPEPGHEPGEAGALGLPRRALVPVGGGKDSLVTVELLRRAREPMALAWVGRSELIAACVEASGLPGLNIDRQVAPELFDFNRAGAWNGHVPVTAINSAILTVAALLYGFDAIVFSNEASANVGNTGQGEHEVNHQYSKSLHFETLYGDWVRRRVAADLDYFSLLRPLSELEITRRFAALERYHGVFSSCNRNFRLLGPRPQARWCGQCPKCLFVFLALAPFMAKTRLLRIFGRNLLDDPALDAGFDAILEWNAMKPFECVGEGREARAAMKALCERAEWREDHQPRRFLRQLLPALGPTVPSLEALAAERGPQRVPARLLAWL